MGIGKLGGMLKKLVRSDDNASAAARPRSGAVSGGASANATDAAADWVEVGDRHAQIIGSTQRLDQALHIYKTLVADRYNDRPTTQENMAQTRSAFKAALTTVLHETQEIFETARPSFQALGRFECQEVFDKLAELDPDTMKAGQFRPITGLALNEVFVKQTAYLIPIFKLLDEHPVSKEKVLEALEAIEQPIKTKIKHLTDPSEELTRLRPLTELRAQIEGMTTIDAVAVKAALMKPFFGREARDIPDADIVRHFETVTKFVNEDFPNIDMVLLRAKDQMLYMMADQMMNLAKGEGDMATFPEIVTQFGELINNRILLKNADEADDLDAYLARKQPDIDALDPQMRAIFDQAIIVIRAKD